jgi:hypothetical protein
MSDADCNTSSGAAGLLPCLFCGSDKVTPWQSEKDGVPCWCVFCEGCEAEGPHTDASAEVATALWNKRVASKVELRGTHAQSIYVNGELWGYAIWVGRWYVVYRWESEMTGSLESPKVADTEEEIKHVVLEQLTEYEE